MEVVSIHPSVCFVSDITKWISVKFVVDVYTKKIEVILILFYQSSSVETVLIF